MHPAQQPDPIPEEEHDPRDQSSERPTPEHAPDSSASESVPAIVSETPIGGKLPQTGRSKEPAEADPAPDPVPAESETPGSTEPSSDPASIPGPATSITAAAAEPDEPAAAPESATTALPEPEPETGMSTDASTDTPADTATNTTTGPDTETPAAPRPSREALVQPEPDAEIGFVEPDEWDDDLSPELAAVLFGGAKASAKASSTPKAAADTPSQTTAPTATVSTTEATTTAAASTATIPPAEPITLTDIAQAQTLPITAEGVAAPSPATTLEGRRRYQRVEQPVDNEGGQHIKESWDYLGDERPTLNGRDIRKVTSETYEYPDGSWKWTYKRQYSDRGYDQREVGANAERTYIERRDTIKQRDADDQKVVRRTEEESLIFAAPPREEKRGFLSSLVGRADDDQPSPAIWREADSGEARHARREGGRAFKRGLFANLF